VRIALGLKGIACESVPVSLKEQAHRGDGFLATNPQGLVPALRTDSGEIIAQSTAILEWLEERYPDPPLYPGSSIARAQHRALCQHIACDIHPLNNLRVLRYLKGPLEQTQESVNTWYAHWISEGFRALEIAAAGLPAFSLGDRPGMFEVMLVPQMFNARRFEVDLDRFPALCALDARCAGLEAFATAHPYRQEDAPAAT
jgi:maleylacetoacetate isomerase